MRLSVYPFSGGVAKVRARNDKFGYVNGQGQWIVPPKWKEADQFVGDIAEVKMAHEERYFIRRDGSFIHEQPYTDSWNFKNGIRAFELNGRWGLINYEGRIIAEPEYDSYIGYENGIAGVEKDGVYRWFFRDGVEEPGPRFDPDDKEDRDSHTHWDDNISLGKFFHEGGIQGLVDREGRVLVPAKPWAIEEYSERVFAVTALGNNDLAGYIEIVAYENVPTGYNLETAINRAFVDSELRRDQQLLADQQAEEMAEQAEKDAKAKKRAEEDAMRERQKNPNLPMSETTTFEFVSEIQWGSSYPFQEGRALVSKDRKRAFLDHEGNVVGNHWYTSAEPYVGGIARVKFEGEKNSFYVDLDGNRVMECDGWSVPNEQEFREGLLMAWSEKATGFVNGKGEFVIQPQFGSPALCNRGFSEGLAVVSRKPERGVYDLVYGVIDREGNVVVDFQYREISDFHEGHAWVRDLDNKEAIIDRTGKLVTPLGFWRAGASFAEARFQNGWMEVVPPVGSDRQRNYLHISGRLLSPKGFDDVWAFSDGMGLVDYRHYYDANGRLAFSLANEDMGESFHDGLAVVNIDEPAHKYGAVDKTGKLVVPALYEELEDFSEGYAAYQDRTSELWGYIDVKGQVVAPAQWKYVSSVSEGIAMVWTDDYKYGYIRFVRKE
ncbi:MAG: WG repeat-containing protein [Verrucomicrobiota bacterium]